METAFVFNFRRSGLFFQTIYATLCKQKRIRYEMNFKEEIPLGEFPLFCARRRKIMKKKVLGLLLAVMTAAMLTACGSGKEADTSAASESTDAAVSEETSSDESTDAAEDSSAEKKTLKVAMECGYAPYNWTQADDSNGAVKINDSSDYAYGYDVMMAKKIAEENGYELQVYKIEWDGLIMAVQSGTINAIIAGMSATDERKQSVDFSDPYYKATHVLIVKKDFL